MPSDKKRRGKQPHKRQFQGNRFTKRPRFGEEKTVESDVNSKNEESGVGQAASSGHSTSASAENATPTRSERKLFNLFDLSDDSSEESSDQISDCSSGESDSEAEAGGAEVLGEQELGGYRLVDVEILNQNIMSQLSCKFCHSEVKFYEIERKALGSKFAFLCQNRKCDRQTAFPSCPIISEGNVSVHSLLTRTFCAL